MRARADKRGSRSVSKTVSAFQNFCICLEHRKIAKGHWSLWARLGQMQRDVGAFCLIPDVGFEGYMGLIFWLGLVVFKVCRLGFTVYYPKLRFQLQSLCLVVPAMLEFQGLNGVRGRKGLGAWCVCG